MTLAEHVHQKLEQSKMTFKQFFDDPNNLIKPVTDDAEPEFTFHHFSDGSVLGQTDNGDLFVAVGFHHLQLLN